jgi:hypothetical protein
MATGLKDMVYLLIQHLQSATSEGIISTITSIAGYVRIQPCYTNNVLLKEVTEQ